MSADPQAVRAHSSVLIEHIQQVYVAAANAHGAAFASLVVMDACSEALGAAVAPLNGPARTRALAMICEDINESATEIRQRIREPQGASA